MPLLNMNTHTDSLGAHRAEAIRTRAGESFLLCSGLNSLAGPQHVKALPDIVLQTNLVDYQASHLDAQETCQLLSRPNQAHPNLPSVMMRNLSWSRGAVSISALAQPMSHFDPITTAN